MSDYWDGLLERTRARREADETAKMEHDARMASIEKIRKLTQEADRLALSLEKKVGELYRSALKDSREERLNELKRRKEGIDGPTRNDA